MKYVVVALLGLAGCNAQSPAKVIGGGTSSLTYWRDVKPLMDAKCSTCHVDGGIAPFAFDSYADVTSHLAEVDEAVTNRVMPPWLAAPGCNDYLADRSLSDDQIKTVTDWINGGAGEGDQADYVAGAPDFTGALSRVDLSLQMPVHYTPQLSPDDYRCFILDWTPTTTKYVTGFRANPGNKAIVHHVIAYLATPDTVATYQALDDADPAPGYTCFGGPGGTNAGQWIGSWAPGAFGYDEPAGTGILIPPGSKVILQVHYNTASTMAAPDQSSLDFKLDDSVQHQAFDIPWTNIAWLQQGGMIIPAGNANTMHAFDADISQYLSYVTSSTFQNNKPFTVWGTGLHMHTHGIGGRVDLVRGGGQPTECLLDIPRWDFHWQGAYAFQQAKTYNPGDQVHLECHWNNAAGTTDLSWGEGTGDEMCLTGFYITQ